MRHIVKRAGHLESFDDKKLYASIYSACQAARATDAEAELLAEKIVRHLNGWLEHKKEVSSHQIKEEAYGALKEYSPNAAYLYRFHKDLG